MMALVRSLTSFSADSTLRQWSSRFTSAKRGMAPACTIEKLDGDEGVAGHDHFVAGPDAQRGEGDVQGGGAVGGADGEPAALPFGEASSRTPCRCLPVQ